MKDPGAAQGLSGWIEQRSHFTEIDLRHFARRRLEAHEHFRRLARFDGLTQPIHRGFTRGEPRSDIQFLKDDPGAQPLL